MTTMNDVFTLGNHTWLDFEWDSKNPQLRWGLTLITDEKNEKCKQTIRQKVVEYMNRAEKLKEFLDKNNGKKLVPDGGGK